MSLSQGNRFSISFGSADTGCHPMCRHFYFIQLSHIISLDLMEIKPIQDILHISTTQNNAALHETHFFGHSSM